MRKLFLILMTLCAVSWSLMAQNRTYSGSVVDAANNEPLIGATVMPIGGGQGAATDVDGNFTISVPASVKSVKVSYIGYKEQTVALHDKMIVRLASTSTNLDDVVVVAYGTANKESLTGSVAVVGAKEIEDRPVTNVMNALEGSAPGVSVNSSTGYPGSSPQIRIRGFNSFNRNAQEPLYVVDGMIYNGDIADINPADVESMSVLKDAASCALYGSRGANGVVLITTKRAKGQGRADVNLQMSWGAYGLALPLYDRLGADAWMEASLMGFANGTVYTDGVSYADAIATHRNSIMSTPYMLNTNIYGMRGEDGSWIPVDSHAIFDEAGRIAPGVSILPGYNDLDWWDAVTRTGFRQEYNINASGSTEKFDVFASAGYLDQSGYVIETDFKRFTGRLAANFRPVSYFKTGVNLAASYSKGSTANVSATSLNSTINPFQTMFYAPIRPIYAHEADGSIEKAADGSDVYSSTGMNAGGNLVQGTYLNKRQTTNLNVDASIYGTAVLPYGFEATVRGGMYRGRVSFNEYSNNQEGSQKGVGGLDQEYDRYYNYTFSQALNWSREYGLHHIDVLLNHENYKSQTQLAFYRAAGQKLDYNYTVSNFDEITAFIEQITGYTTESYLGRARYNYDQKYFGEVSVNRDGTSQFAKDNRWGTFWSVGASWIISKENFMAPTSSWLNYLKFRAAYGTVGNNQACSYINYLTLFQMSSTGALQLDQLAAPDLKWESTNSLDVALEGSLFNDRFSFNIGFFDKRNADLIYSLVKPWSGGTTNNSGFNPSVLTNIGEMQNYGFELMFGVDIIRNANVTWDFNIDASFIKNKIKKLPNRRDLPGSSLFEGRSIYEKYMVEFAGVDQMNGRALYAMNPDSPDFYTYYDGGTRKYNESLWKSQLDAAKNEGSYVQINGKDYTYNASYAGRKLLGSALPVVYGSFGSNVAWKGIKLGVLFTYSLGGKTFDTNYAQLMGLNQQSASALHTDVLKGWTSVPEGMTADSPNRIDANGIPQLNTQTSTMSTASSSQYLVSASYLTLKNISLNYDLPQKWVNAMKLQNISVGFLMENAFIATARKGLNPQASIDNAVGSGGAYYQPARTYTFQLNVKF